jgi:hypothetical protein
MTALTAARRGRLDRHPARAPHQVELEIAERSR